MCVRHPELLIALSEGGIGWAVMLSDRVDYVLEHSASGTDSRSWQGELRPSEVLARSFWCCSIDDPGNVDAFLARFGPDHLMVESDYPHADSTWPDTPTVFEKAYGHLPEDTQAKIAYRNAAAVFRHPEPA